MRDSSKPTRLIVEKSTFTRRSYLESSNRVAPTIAAASFAEGLALLRAHESIELVSLYSTWMSRDVAKRELKRAVSRIDA